MIRRRIPSRRGFTLTELLIVIGIMILVAILAVPAFRAMTGSRSTEAAQNQISAVVARARIEALGLEEPRGVLFYRDLDSQRIGMVMVRPTNDQPPYELDLVPDRDPVLLPDGVGVQFIDNYTTTGTPPRRTADGYIGFNTRVTPTAAANETVIPHGGVILFDKQGRVTSDTYVFRIRGENPPNAATELGRFLYNDPAMAPGMPQLVPTAGALGEASLGFVLYDAEALSNVHGSGRTTAKSADTDTQVSGSTGNGPFVEEERTEEEWLDENSVPILVNRYNGTLLRGE